MINKSFSTQTNEVSLGQAYLSSLSIHMNELDRIRSRLLISEEKSKHWVLVGRVKQIHNEVISAKFIMTDE